ncbi:heterokaryon incompatibility protein-domain-containing protein [Biscogniauxia marginata]|nr:heterokaryon incompatibility protein-domain-containing protein [Biscogniauxia marginata]
MSITNPTAVFCDLCASIFSEDSYEWWERYWESDPGSFEFLIGYPRQHHASLRSLEFAVEQGCWICTQLCAADPGLITRSSQDFRAIRYRLVRSDLAYKQGFDLKFACSGDDIIVTVQVDDELQTTTYRRLARCSQDQTSTGHGEVASLAHWWLLECIQCHKTCSNLASGDWKPSRLLDISQDNIRLVLTRDEETVGPYATLSHCWGREKFPVLNSNNLLQFLAGVHLNAFPRTFRETIETARRLDVKYLWIDCYCIIQGDDADWESQAPQMGKVYSNSLVNIGAAEAAGPTEGLFRQRRPHVNHRPSITIWWSPKQQLNPRIFRLHVFYRPRLSTLPAMHNHITNLGKCRLYKRGWVAQECILAPRMLSFTSDHIIWQCSEMVSCEKELRVEHPLKYSSAHMFWTLSGFSPEKVNGPSYVERWLATLRRYLISQLTYRDKDIIKAISGLGIVFEQLTGDLFRHGILGPTLPRALLFDTRGPCQTHCVPSWHWSSGGERPYFPSTVTRDVKGSGYKKNLPLAYVFMSDDCKPLAASPSSRDFWPNLLCIGRLGDPDTWGAKIVLDEPASSPGYGDGLGEGSKSSSDCKEVACLPLTYDLMDMWKNADCGVMIRGLALRKSDNGAYRRLGTFYNTMHLSMTELTKHKPQLVVLE